MALFRVTEILAGNKVKVEGWSWNNVSGTDIVIAGYSPITTSSSDAITKLNENLAKNRLIDLIQGKEIELGRVLGHNQDGSITCVAFYNGVDIAKYFPEYSQHSS